MTTLRRFGLLAIIPLALCLAACSSRPTSAEIESTVPDCSDHEAQIAMLKQEMLTTQERIAAGVQTVVPSAAVVGLLSGRWVTNKNIASGEYEKMLNEKIAEIRAACE